MENNMQPVAMSQTQAQVRVNAFIRGVYNWMAAGLALMGLVAYYIAGNEALLRWLLGNRMLFFGLIIGQLALVFTLSASSPSPG